MILPAILLCLGAEIVDLGVLTPQRGFVLERNTDRPDFSHFRAEFISFPSSNRTTLRLTNELLTISEVAALPSGRTVLGLTSVCQDGQTSAASFYRFDIRRAAPPAPSMRPVALSSTVNEIRPFQGLKTIRVDPPLPFTPTNEVSIPPMPGGRSREYGEHLDRVADFNAKRQGMRRNQ